MGLPPRKPGPQIGRRKARRLFGKRPSAWDFPRFQWPADAPIGNANNTDTVFCLDAKTGKEIWKDDYPAELGDKYFEGGTTGTPTIDGDRAFTLSRWGDVFCFEADSGKVVWNRNLASDAGARVPGWGFGGSPTVHENMLLLNVGETGMALDKSSGKTIWQSAPKDCGYSTPLPSQEKGKWTVLLGSEKAYLAVDLLTGKELWSIRWLTQYGVNAPDPIPVGDRVFISSGYGKGAALLKITDQPEPEVVWKSKVLATQLNSSVLVDGFLYGLSGDGGDDAPLKCVEYATGTEKWSYPQIGTGGIIAADGKLIVTGSKGELLVFAAIPDEAKIPRERKSWAANDGPRPCSRTASSTVAIPVATSSALTSINKF